MHHDGIIKFDCKWTQTDLPTMGHLVVEELIACRQALFGAGWIGIDPFSGVGFGNVSVRVGSNDSFLITGSQTGHLPQLTADHLSLVEYADVTAGRIRCRGRAKASSESLSHAILYRQSPGIRAVLHIHNTDMWRRWLYRLPTTPEDAAYGTPAMAIAIAQLCSASIRGYEEGIMVMGGHQDGILAFGDSPETALRLLNEHR